MKNSALVVIDLQNDITKNYREIIDNVNRAIDFALEKDMHVVYIKQKNVSPRHEDFQERNSRRRVGCGTQNRIG